ncbi:MAG: hypothetical protein DMG09_11345 [Acidobacteria bacterium]|nr:MAG: hypothetical protein DMG09_11345 [Acidobacteriota bacterium]
MEFSILQVSINGHLEGLPGGSVYRCLALRYGGDLLLLQPQRLLPVFRSQREAVPDAVHCVVHVVPLAALVDHRLAPFLPGFRFRGRPPSLPFSLELWALRFERTAPRQAGQKQTSGTLCIGHRFMGRA